MRFGVGCDSIIRGVSTSSYVGAFSGAYRVMLLLSEALSDMSRRANCWHGMKNFGAHRTSPLETDWLGGVVRRGFQRLTVISCLLEKWFSV